MNTRHFRNVSIPSVVIVGALTACGGSGADIDQVSRDFASPSGSTKDETGLIAASAEQSNANSNVGIAAASGAGFGGFGLRTEQGAKWLRVSPAAIARSHLQRTAERLTGRKSFALTGDALDDCFPEAEFSDAEKRKAAAALQSGGDYSMEYSQSVDLATCGGSGTISGSFVMKLEDGRDLFLDVEFDYQNVKVEQQEMNGSIAVALEMKGFLNQERSSQSSSSMILAWDLSVTTPELGAVLSKGGIKISAVQNGTVSEEKLEVLVYVKNGSGKEVSYVLEASNTNGEARLTIRGADGSVSCTYSAATGAGQCNGMNSAGETISWTSEEGKAVTTRR